MSLVTRGSRGHRRWTRPARAVSLSYLAVLAVGTLLLALPFSKEGPGSANLLQAAFTATSMVCVTGLTVVDTATFWTPLGQVIITVLTQIGGLGVMTLTALITLRLAHRVGLRQRMQVSAEAPSVGIGSVRRVARAVVISAFVVEGVVSLIVGLRFWLGYDQPFPTAFGRAIFQSVSAFNTVGLALFSDNLMGFAGDWLVILPTMAGVIIGGLGLPVLRELWHNRRRPWERWKLFRADRRGTATFGIRRRIRLSLNTRIMLLGTALLLVGGLLYFLVQEWSNPLTMGPFSVPTKVLASFTMSVVPRTGGFNSINIADMQPDAWLVTDFLMFIGGGPAGTAGGLKVTTFAVIVAVAVTEIRGNRHTRMFDRSVPQATQRSAMAVGFAFMAVAGLGTFLLLHLSSFPLDQVLFEALSALSTVGLTTGITAELNGPAQTVLMVMMFIGRLGPITLAAALALNTRRTHYELPEERPYIG